MVFWVSARISRTDFPDRSACGTVAALLNVRFCLVDLSNISAAKILVFESRLLTVVR